MKLDYLKRDELELSLFLSYNFNMEDIKCIH